MIDRLIMFLFGLSFIALLLYLLVFLIGGAYSYIKCTDEYPAYICHNTDYWSIKSCIKDGKTKDDCFRLLTRQSLKVAINEELE